MKAFIIGLFLVGALTVAVLTWLSHRDGSKIPPVGQMAGFVMAYQVGRVPVGRIAVVGFWWWVGWHFLAR